MQEFTLINTTAISVNTMYRTFQGRILIHLEARPEIQAAGDAGAAGTAASQAVPHHHGAM